MERSDVTKPDQPLRVVTKACEVQLIQQVNRSVTTTAAQDGLNFFIVHGCLKIFEALMGGTGIRAP